MIHPNQVVSTLPSIYLDKQGYTREVSGTTFPTRIVCNFLPKVLDFLRLGSIESLHEHFEDWLQQLIPPGWLLTKTLQSVKTTKHFLPIFFSPLQLYGWKTASYGTFVGEVLLHSAHHDDTCCCLIGLSRCAESRHEPLPQRRIKDVLLDLFATTQTIELVIPSNIKHSQDFVHLVSKLRPVDTEQRVPCYLFADFQAQLLLTFVCNEHAAQVFGMLIDIGI